MVEYLQQCKPHIHISSLTYVSLGYSNSTVSASPCTQFPQLIVQSAELLFVPFFVILPGKYELEIEVSSAGFVPLSQLNITTAVRGTSPLRQRKHFQIKDSSTNLN